MKVDCYKYFLLLIAELISAGNQPESCINHFNFVDMQVSP